MNLFVTLYVRAVTVPLQRENMIFLIFLQKFKKNEKTNSYDQLLPVLALSNDFVYCETLIY